MPKGENVSEKLLSGKSYDAKGHEFKVTESTIY